jgi:ATP-dependent RNA helicase DDX56/DBP9
MSLSFVVTKEEATRCKEKDKAIARMGRVDDERALERVEQAQKERGASLKPYLFDMTQVEGFRYRMEDALRAVTRTAVREARLKELKQEILHSERLKAHFEDNPKDLNFLRHDRTLHPTRVQQHMKHVPQYLMPKIAAPAGTPDDGVVLGESTDVNYVPFHKPDYQKRRRAGTAGKKRKNDPLKTFSMVRVKAGGKRGKGGKKKPKTI